MPTARVLDALQVLVRPPDDCTDGEYLHRFLHQQDEAAFAELVRRHGPMVYGACRRILHNSPEADDAFQATFFVLARKAASIRSSHAVGSWLYGVAVRVATKARVQAVKRRVRHMAAAKPEAVHPVAPQADLWAVLDEELAKLPDDLRQAVLACDVNGHSRSQAARHLGWPEGTVAKRLAKAREQLAKQLTRRGITLSVSALSVALAESATAAVPHQLVMETAAHAAAFALGGGGGSLAVRALADGVLRSLKVGVLKVWALVGLLALSLAGGGLMLAGGPGDGDKKADTLKADAAKMETMWKETHTIDYPGTLPVSVVFSPDGKMLITGDTNSVVTALVFDGYDAKWRWKSEVVEANPKPVYALAYSADKKKVYATTEHGLRVIDAATGKGEAGIEAKNSNPTAIGVFHEQDTGRDGDDRKVQQVAFGNANGYVVKTWLDWSKMSTLNVLTTSKGVKPVGADAAPLAAFPLNRAERPAIMTGPIDLKTGKNVLWAYSCGGPGGNRLMPGHVATVVSAAWAKEGSTAVTGDADGRVIVWDAKAMKETRRLELGGRVAALAISDDGTHTAAYVLGKQGEVYVWETAKPTNAMKPIHTDAGDFGGTANFASLAFSPDGKRLAGCAANKAWLARGGDLVGKVRVWELANEPKAQRPPRLLYTKALPKDSSKHFVVLDNRTILSASAKDSAIDFRDLCDDGKILSRIGLGKYKIGGLKLSADRQWLAMEQHAATEPKPGDKPRTTFDVGVWDLKQFRKTLVVSDYRQLLDIAADGKVIAVVRDKQIELWDVGAKKLAKAAPFQHTRIDAAAFSPDGKLLAISDRNDLVLWRWTENAHERIELGRTVGSLTFSPDGKFLAEGPTPGENVHLRDVATRKVVQTLSTAANQSMNVPRTVYSNDRRTMIGIAGPHDINLWDTATGGIAHSITLPNARPVNLDISPNGRYLAAMIEDTDGLKLSAWDLNGDAAAKPVGAAPPAAAVPPAKLSWKEGTPIPLANWPVTNLAVSPDGKMLAVAANGTVSLIDPVTHAKLDKGRVAQLKAPAKNIGVAFSPTGKLGVTCQNGVAVFDHLLDEVPHWFGGANIWEGIPDFEPHQFVWLDEVKPEGWSDSKDARFVATDGVTYRELGWTYANENGKEGWRKHTGDKWDGWKDARHKSAVLAAGKNRLLYSADNAAGEFGERFNVFAMTTDVKPKTVTKMAGHKSRPTAGAVSSDGKLFLSGDEAGDLIAWDGDAFKMRQHWKLGGTVTNVALASDNKTAAVLNAKNVPGGTEWDLYLFDATQTTEQPRPFWTSPTPIPLAVSRAASLVFHPDGTKLYTSFGEPYGQRGDPGFGKPIGIRVWEKITAVVPATVPARREIEELRPKKDVDPHPFAVAFSPGDKTLAVSDGDGTVTLWDAATLKRLWKYEANGSQQASGLDFSPVGDEVAVATGDSVHYLDAKTGKQLRHEKDQKMYAVAYSRDGKRVAVTDSLMLGTAGARWLMLTDLPVPVVGVNVKLAPCGLAWSPDGKRVAALGQPQSGVPGSGVAVWEPGENPKQWLPQDGKLDWLFAVQWAKDGQSILAGGDGGRILVWSGKDFATRREIKTDGWNVRSLVLSPDGKTVYAGLTLLTNPKALADRWVRTGCVKAFDVATGKATFDRTIEGEAAIALALDSTGKSLAVVSGVAPFEAEPSTWSGKGARVEVWALPAGK